MIEITVKKGKYVDIEVKGHAGANEIGKDVVCAAVSTLCLTTVRAMNQIQASGFEGTLGKGYAHIRCKRVKANKAYIHTILSGFVMLSEMYPQYITLDKQNIDDVNGEA